jgi:hypothetical protein
LFLERFVLQAFQSVTQVVKFSESGVAARQGTFR